jgi:hypothetical protein
LLKRGEKGLIKSFKSRWFVYDDESGYLRYFKNNKERLSLGYGSPKPHVELSIDRAINLMKATSIEQDDKNGKRLNIKLPNRTYCLQAEVRM